MFKTLVADVTLSANTCVPCAHWKLSGAADPLLELYSAANEELLVQNGDGNKRASKDCYAAVLSYGLERDDCRAIIRNLKCAYGNLNYDY